MSFGFDLDLTNVSTEGSREPLEAGTYIAQIKKVEKKTSKASAENKYINVMYKLCDNDKRNGAVVFDMVTTHNKSEKAQEIGRSRLKSMIIAAGSSKDQVNNQGPDFLLEKKVRITVVIEPDQNGEKRNKVVQVLPAGDIKSTDNSGLGDFGNIGF